MRKIRINQLKLVQYRKMASFKHLLIGCIIVAFFSCTEKRYKNILGLEMINFDEFIYKPLRPRDTSIKYLNLAFTKKDSLSTYYFELQNEPLTISLDSIRKMTLAHIKLAQGPDVKIQVSEIPNGLQFDYRNYDANSDELYFDSLVYLSFDKKNYFISFQNIGQDSVEISNHKNRMSQIELVNE